MKKNICFIFIFALLTTLNLFGMERLSSISLSPGNNELYGAAIDTVNGYGYFGTNTSPGKIIKVRLPDMVVVSSLTLNTGESFIQKVVLDWNQEFGYFGASTIPGVIVKIRLSDLTRVGAVVLPREDGSAQQGFLQG